MANLKRKEVTTILPQNKAKEDREKTKRRNRRKQHCMQFTTAIYTIEVCANKIGATESLFLLSGPFLLSAGFLLVAHTLLHGTQEIYERHVALNVACLWWCHRQEELEMPTYLPNKFESTSGRMLANATTGRKLMRQEIFSSISCLYAADSQPARRKMECQLVLKYLEFLRNL